MAFNKIDLTSNKGRSCNKVDEKSVQFSERTRQTRVEKLNSFLFSLAHQSISTYRHRVKFLGQVLQEWVDMWCTKECLLMYHPRLENETSTNERWGGVAGDRHQGSERR